MLKRLALMACLMLVISSCNESNPTARPSEIVPPTAPATLEPTPTESFATSIVVPTMTLPPGTPPPVFSPHGPFLAFVDDSNQPSRIIFFDPIQQSRFVISKPDGDILQWNISGLSPDGQYLAYYTGHLDSLTDLSAVPALPQHIELNIMRTLDGSIVFRTSLLNKDYPKIFLQAADSIMANPPSDFDVLEYSSREDLASTLQGAFIDDLYIYSWSPDGHVLAFASGLDGTSSDVYTYNMDTGAVTRITDGPSEVYEIRWSPDGNWILNSGIYWVGEGMCGTWYLSAANGSGSSVFSIKGAVDSSTIRGCYFDKWVSDHQALVYESENGRGNYNVEVLDIDQKSIDLVWPHTFQSFAFDPIFQQAYISTEGELLQDNTYFQQGTYQVDVVTHKTVSIAQEIDSLMYLGWVPGETIAGIPFDSFDICFLPSRSCSGFGYSGQKQFSGISVSTSRKNLVFYSDTGLWHVFPDSASKTATRVYTARVDSVTWSPNPDSNLANDLALLDCYIPPFYYLYNPVTDVTNPLDFNGSDFGGWYWRK
ncbi:MAG: hypothetical protein ABSF99_09455 [Anaerolineales bacterium]|jgi:dipeptidyl aminopeptidase/acylaminoacyl peptidase